MKSIYKKFISIIIMTVILALNNGCQFTGLSFDELIIPPMLTAEQGEIFDALTAMQDGNKIKLLYPQSGSNRSAFIMANIAGNNYNQALVFYENISSGGKADKSTVRFSVLDREDGKWVAKYSGFGDGTYVDKVIIMQNNDNGKTYIIVGYGTLNVTDKTFHIYTYNNGKLDDIYKNETGEKETYMEIEVFDIDGDGNDEIVYIGRKYDSVGQMLQDNYTDVMKMLKFNGDDVEYVNEVNLNRTVTAYISMEAGKIGDGSPGIYLDGYSVVGTQTVYNTQILSMEDGKLYNFTASNNLLAATQREKVENCRDIDGDGALEIPTTELFPGYKNADDSEKLYLTKWMQFDKNFFTEKVRSYVNIKYKYIFKFPPEWEGKVTARSYVDRSEVCFFLYNNDNIDDETYELLRIRAVLSSEVNQIDNNDFIYINPGSHIVFMYKLPERKVSNYAISDSYVIDNFISYMDD